jgi:hypothetical protein
MNFFANLRKLVSGRDLEQEAAGLADVLEAPVWDLVQRRAGSLSRYEIRGYVRARSARLLNEEIRRHPWSAKTADIVRSMTLVELTGRLQSRLLHQVARPALRAA